jgi:ornithine decarboxylase
MYSDTVNRLVPELRRNKGIDKLGIHFHRKTQNLSEWALRHELSQLLKEETLKSIDYLNIGGGIPVVYKNFRMDMTPRIFQEIGKLRKWLSGYGIRLMSEPGRYLAAPCIRLVASVKMVYDDNIIINCSVYNSAMDTFVASTKLEVEGELAEGAGKAYTIKGYTPDAMDIFRYRVYLPEPKVGERLVFLNAGAYNFSTDFCGLKKLRTEIVD